MTSTHYHFRLAGAHWRFLLATLAAVLGVALTLSLACWQLRRAAAKQALAAAMARQQQQAPWDNAALVAWLQRRGVEDAALPDGDALQHPVQLRGQWLGEQTLYLDNRQMDARPGFFVLTPLRLAAPHADVVIAVQRGWAARNFLERSALPAVQTPATEVVVTGRLQGAPARLYEFGAHAVQEASRIRQNIDLAAWARAAQLPLLAALTVLQTGADSEGLLRHWPPPDFGIERHYGYAAQWFALAALITLLYVWFQIVRRFSRRAPA